MAKGKVPRRVVHIHNHSIFSQGDAMCKPEELAKRAAEIGIDTIVLTDHGNISGVIQMKKACKKHGIKFIPACEMYEAPDRLVKEDRSTTGHITMLPVNNQGWADLQYLIADANTEGFYYKPRTDMNIIKEHNLGKNLIATSGCLAGAIPQMLLAGNYDEAKDEALYRAGLFHGYYLEIQDNGSKEQQIVNMQLIQMSGETGIPLVYAKDVHYVRPEDKDAHHTLVAIGRKQTIYECAPYEGTNTYHLASADEVYDWAKQNNIPIEAIENTWKIADECNVELELGKNLMPEYPFCEDGYTDSAYLRKLLNEGLIEYAGKQAAKGKRLNLKDYIYRNEMELSVVNPKGFPSYFLILWDIIGWASDRKKWLSYPKNREWLKIPGNEKYEFYPEFLVGPGRGSAAGAMIAFLLKITRLDPIEYGFMFERFLNPYRNSPPDIDVDFPGDNHDMLLDFVAQRYGRDRTAQILTFTKLKLRSSIDKICRALEVRDPNNPKKVTAYGYAVADEVKKVLEVTGDQGKLPNQDDASYSIMMDICVNPHKYEEFDSALPKFVDASRAFRQLMQKYPELDANLKKIEGCIETSGIHAGGIIISKRPLSIDCPTIMPTDKSKATLPITMWDYPDCEEVGLLKMDLLRTSTLRIISKTLDLIRETKGEVIDIYDIGRDDPKVFELISRGETHGLFQINGGGITAYTKQVKPTTQAEIIDILALYRPGPLDAVLENGNTIAQQYVINGSRKKKEYMKEVHKALRPTLGDTRGQMTYQEQVMKLVQDVAGYNLGHADSFRRVIGKKKIKDVKKLYDEFMYGHKYVIEKYEKLEADYPTMKKSQDKDGNEIIKIKSNFDGLDLELTMADIKEMLANTKKAMASHEIIGAIANGFSEKFAHQLFAQMAKFAGYAFNKPHSGCYADETYQTAWLKCYYPDEFMTANLTVRAEGANAKDKTLDNLKEAKRMGIQILPPSINTSVAGFYPETDGIRFGLQSIAGVGEGVISPIMEIRQNGGPFKSFDDFLTRTTFKGSKVNRSVYRTLIKAGCFDEFEQNRYKLLNYYNLSVRKDKVYRGSEFELEKETTAIKGNHSVMYDEASFSDKKALEMERELIGIYVSGSPYDGLPFTSMSEMDLSTRRNKVEYEVGGRILKVKPIKTKAGKKMAFLTLETQLEPFDVTIFPETYDDVEQHLYADNIVVVKGYKEKDYRDPDKETFICSKILVKKAKKLKKEMGVKDNAPATIQPDDMPVLTQSEKPAPKADPVADLFGDRKKKKKAV